MSPRKVVIRLWNDNVIIATAAAPLAIVAGIPIRRYVQNVNTSRRMTVSGTLDSPARNRNALMPNKKIDQ